MRHRGANRTRRKSQVIPHSVPPPFSLSLSLSLSVRARAHTSTVGQESTITLWSSGGSIPREEAAAVSDPAEYAVHTSSSVTSPSLSLSIERSHVVALAAPQTPPQVPLRGGRAPICRSCHCRRLRGASRSGPGAWCSPRLVTREAARRRSTAMEAHGC